MLMNRTKHPLLKKLDTIDKSNEMDVLTENAGVVAPGDQNMSNVIQPASEVNP